MRILIYAFASAFTENLTYKENYYFDLLRKKGHEVIVFTNSQKYSNGKIINTNNEEIILDNSKIFRRKYQFFISKYITSKIRKFSGFWKFLISFKPEIIISFGLQSYDFITLAKYKKLYKNTLFIAESHEDFNNSATNFISKFLLHGVFYKWIIIKSLKWIDKIYYITLETKIFLKEMYKLNEDKLFFSPLGGTTFSDDYLKENRNLVLKDYNLDPNSIIFFHSGKLNKLKSTLSLIESFSKVKSSLIRLFIAGTVDPEIDNIFFKLINLDKRVIFLGWLSDLELFKYMAAADIYIQPGSQSATFQVSSFFKNALVAFKHDSYFHLFNENIMYIQSNDEIEDCIFKLTNNPNLINSLKLKSYYVAINNLDYNSQVEFIISYYIKLQGLIC
jgi:DNA-binding transcriptional regulator/RsmH inhibitor MraZ